MLGLIFAMIMGGLLSASMALLPVLFFNSLNNPPKSTKTTPKVVRKSLKSTSSIDGIRIDPTF